MSPRARLRVGAVAVILALVAGIAPGPVGGTARAAVAVTGLYLDTMSGDGVGNGVPALWPIISTAMFAAASAENTR